MPISLSHWRGPRGDRARLVTYNQERPHDSLGRVTAPYKFLPRPTTAGQSLFQCLLDGEAYDTSTPVSFGSRLSSIMGRPAGDRPVAQVTLTNGPLGGTHPFRGQ